MPQAVKPKQLTASFVTMASAMLVAIGLVYVLSEIGALRPVVARARSAQERPPWRGYLVQWPLSNRLGVWLAARW